MIKVDRRTGLYIIRNIINQKFYLGSARDFYQRKHNHFYELKNEIHHSRYLQRSWHKYGSNRFRFEPFLILPSNISENDLLAIEDYYIKLLKPEYNSSDSAIRPIITKEGKEVLAKKASKTYILLFPDGTEKTVFNLSKFARENDLNIKYLHAVANGYQSQHKGIKIRLQNENNFKFVFKDRSKQLKAARSTWEIIFPNGKKEINNNLKSFCIQNNLSLPTMYALSHGKLKSYKGFKCRSLTQIMRKTTKGTILGRSKLAKLTEIQINEIKNMYMDGISSQKEIGRLFRVHQNTISRIVRNKTYK